MPTPIKDSQSDTLTNIYGGNNLDIVVDTREPPEWIGFLRGYFPQHNFIQRKLDEGDFESSRVLVERKEIKDLYGSIMGSKGKPGRLPAQVKRLSLHDEKIILLLITGNMQNEMRMLDKELGIQMNPEIIHGTLASIACRERIHIMWIEDEWNAIIEVVKFMQKVDEGKYMIPGRREPVALMARYLGINTTQMEILMSKYHCIGELSKADAKELQRIPGIGKAKSSTIIERLNVAWS
jgi:ERCC4-type nuclease